MKIHFGSPAFPWHMKARLPSVYARGMEYATYQHGQIGRVFGISFGQRRFFGFVVAGPFVQESLCVPSDPSSQTKMEQQNYNCPCAHPSQCDDSCMAKTPSPHLVGHTPTPWAIRQERDDYEVYPLRDGPPKFGEWSAVATCHDQYDDAGEAKANAELIVAAVNSYVAPPSPHLVGITLTKAEVEALFYGAPKFEFSEAMKNLATWLAEQVKE